MKAEGLMTEVLIADDDDEDFKIFSGAVEDLQLTILLERAKDGEILLKILDENVPDLLFLDILLPLKDGKQCLKHIRADKRYDSLPVIIYTSLHDLDTVEFTYREGSNLFVHKPNSYSELLDVLRKIFTIDWKKMLYYPPLSDYVLNPQ